MSNPVLAVQTDRVWEHKINCHRVPHWVAFLFWNMRQDIAFCIFNKFDNFWQCYLTVNFTMSKSALDVFQAILVLVSRSFPPSSNWCGHLPEEQKRKPLPDFPLCRLRLSVNSFPHKSSFHIPHFNIHGLASLSSIINDRMAGGRGYCNHHESVLVNLLHFVQFHSF